MSRYSLLGSSAFTKNYGTYGTLGNSPTVTEMQVLVVASYEKNVREVLRFCIDQLIYAWTDTNFKSTKAETYIESCELVQLMESYQKSGHTVDELKAQLKDGFLEDLQDNELSTPKTSAAFKLKEDVYYTMAATSIEKILREQTNTPIKSFA